MAAADVMERVERAYVTAHLRQRRLVSTLVVLAAAVVAARLLRAPSRARLTLGER